MILPQTIVEAALEQAGEYQVAVIVSHTSRVDLRWAANSLTTNGDTVATQVDVVAMHPAGGTATTSGQVAGPDDITDLVTRAKAAAATSQASEENRPLVDGGVSPDWDDAPGATSADMLTTLASGLGATFRTSGGIEHFGYAEHDLSTTFLGTTAGTRLRHLQPQGRAEFTAKSHDRTRSAWSGSADPRLDLDVAAIADGLRADLANQGGPCQISPGRQRVILSPSATADLMIDMYYAADARSALEGRSVFAGADGHTRIGERIGGSVTLSSDPADPGMACVPFEVTAASSDSASTFDNGLPLAATDWIRDGVLTHLVTTRHTAELVGGRATPGVDNLRLAAGGSGSLADLVARTQDALLITCLWYNRVVDPQTLLLTGLTRDGVYVVKDGRVVGSCGNFRFNESPVSLLGRIVDSSSEERTLAREMGDYFNRATMPALLVEDFNLSTASEAH